MPPNINRLLKERGGIRLDIACGAQKQGPDWVGMDIAPLPGVDIVHDINVHPWPLPDECVSIAVASHIIEHIPPVVIDGGKTRFPFLEFMDELWRVMRVDGAAHLVAPHGSSQGYLQDPTHCNAINEATFVYFDPLDPVTNGLLYKCYRPKPWRIDRTDFTWNPVGNIECALIKRRDDRSYHGEKD